MHFHFILRRRKIGFCLRGSINITLYLLLNNESDINIEVAFQINKRYGCHFDTAPVQRIIHY